MIPAGHEVHEQAPEDVVDLDLCYDSLKTIRSPSATGDTPKRIRKITDLSRYTKLRRLDLSGNIIASVEGLNVCQSLEALNLSRNNIRTFSESSFSNQRLRASLTNLNLSGNFISAIGPPLGLLVGLKKLDLSGNKIHRLEEVKRLRTLTVLSNLNLTGNPICEVGHYRNYVLFNCPKLDDLDHTIVTEQNLATARRAFQTRHTRAEKSELERLKTTRTVDAKNYVELEKANARLRTELAVKSKLLDRKDQQWTSMTEELTQTKTELAFLKIDEGSSSSSKSPIAQSPGQLTALEMPPHGPRHEKPSAAHVHPWDTQAHDYLHEQFQGHASFSHCPPETASKVVVDGFPASEVAQLNASRADVLHRQRDIQTQLGEVTGHRKQLERRLMGITNDERMIFATLEGHGRRGSAFSHGASSPSPSPGHASIGKRPHQKHMTSLAQRYEHMKRATEHLGAWVAAMEDKMAITQDLLVLRTEMMVLEDSLPSLDLRSLHERYENASQVVSDAFNILDTETKEAIAKNEETNIPLMTEINNMSPPSEDLFDKGTTKLTDELRVLQDRHKVGDQRYQTIKKELNDLEADVLVHGSPPSQKHHHHSQSGLSSYGDGNATDAFITRLPEEKHEDYRNRLREKLDDLRQVKHETDSQIRTLQQEESNLHVELKELENQELSIELQISKVEIRTRREQVKHMSELLHASERSAPRTSPLESDSPEPEYNPLEGDMPDLYTVPGYADNTSPPGFHSLRPALSIAQLNEGGREENRRSGRKSKDNGNRTRRQKRSNSPMTNSETQTDQIPGTAWAEERESLQSPHSQKSSPTGRGLSPTERYSTQSSPTSVSPKFTSTNLQRFQVAASKVRSMMRSQSPTMHNAANFLGSTLSTSTGSVGSQKTPTHAFGRPLKRSGGRRGSVDQHGRNLPWDRSHDDELVDEFGVFKQLKARGSPVVKLNERGFLAPTKSHSNKKQGKILSGKSTLAPQQRTAQKNSRGRRSDGNGAIDSKGDTVSRAKAVDLSIFKSSLPKGKGKAWDNPTAEAEYQKMVIRHEAGALHQRMARSASQTMKWDGVANK